MRAPVLAVLTMVAGLAGSDALAQNGTAVVVETDVIFSRDQGAALLADIAYPRGGRGLPAIVYVHGGRWRGGARVSERALDVGDWAASGHFAMTIDHRLVGSSPAPAPYQDLLSAIRSVHAHADRYGIDRERVYVIGASSGGHLAALVATLGAGPYQVTGSWPEASTEIRAAISVAAPYDLTTLSWGDLWRPLEGDPDEARRSASPIRSVSGTTRPILVIDSDRDRSVPVQQALEMVEALKAAGVPHRFVHRRDRGHMGITQEVVREVRDFIAQLERSS